ncbi:MAG TPA: hypothetical protein VK550_00815 [Polyangiaceae bacterium]|nr:hypothetical protein [Polyangiaceae bacterium]
MRASVVAALVLFALPACGEDEGAPGLIDAGASDGSCAPQSAASFTPTWKTPEVTLNACTDAQIDEELRRCESASGTASECTAFNRDPANAACRSCLYSTEDESSYGPLIYLKNRVLALNLPGCLALADGNLGATGCGAQVQALEACKDAVCIRTCATYDAYQHCTTEAGNTVCQPYLDDSRCGDPSTYAPCLDHATFEEFFRSLAKFFCGSGFAGGGMPDAGRADAATARFGASSSPFRRLDGDALRTQVNRGIGEGIGR